MRKLLTLCLAVRDGKILLGMKKRGFGAGRWNGFGGKVEVEETIEEGARREMQEECGVLIESMEEVGVHEFEFAAKPARNASPARSRHSVSDGRNDAGGRGEILEVHVFRVGTWVGEPVETEEMKPAWFAFSTIPYETMWPDDRYWLPLFLEGQCFRTKFLFGEGDAILEQAILPFP